MANKTVAIKADNWTDIPLVYQDNGDGTYSPTAATVGQGKLTLVTPVLDTSAYVSGDVLFVPIAFNGARVNGGRSYLQSLVAVDSDDQGYAMELYFSSSSWVWSASAPATGSTSAACAWQRYAASA
jgi:hypothetical protein